MAYTFPILPSHWILFSFLLWGHHIRWTSHLIWQVPVTTERKLSLSETSVWRGLVLTLTLSLSWLQFSRFIISSLSFQESWVLITALTLSYCEWSWAISFSLGHDFSIWILSNLIWCCTWKQQAKLKWKDLILWWWFSNHREKGFLYLFPLKCWQPVSTETLVSFVPGEVLPILSGLRFTSYPPARECCKAIQNKDLLVPHFKWISSLSPT